MKSLIHLLQLRTDHDPTRQIYLFLRNGEDYAGSLTIGQLQVRAHSIAQWLLANGASGQPVLLAFPTGIDFICSFFGCLYAEALAVPVSVALLRREENRLEAIAKDSGAGLILNCGLNRSQRRLAGLKSVSIEEIAGFHGHAAMRSPQANTVAYLQYTSGSTQEPRGVMVTHGNVLANMDYIDNGFSHSSDSVALSWLPHFHDMGLVYGVLQPLHGNFRSVLMSPSSFVQNPARWLNAISTFNISHTGGPNFAYNLCINQVSDEVREQLQLNSWRVAFNGAEPVAAETLRNFAKKFGPCGFRSEAFYPAYGLAEATLKVTGPAHGMHFSAKLVDTQALGRNEVVETELSNGAKWIVGCGISGSGTEIAIVDPESRTECPDSRVGEIWVRGPSVAAGYWRRPDATKETFRASIVGSDDITYLRTGDLGFMHNGQLFVSGRLKDLIVIRGRNYYPQDIETSATRSHGALRSDRAAAFALDSTNSETLAITLEISPELLPEAEKIAGLVRSVVAAEHALAVSAVIFLRPGLIPRTSSGKIQRNECRRKFISGELPLLSVSRNVLDPSTQLPQPIFLHGVPQGIDPSDQRGFLEQFLASIVALSCGIDVSAVKTDTSAVSHGIDSLAAARLSEQIESGLGIRISPSEILSTITLQEIASRIVCRTNDVKHRPARLEGTPTRQTDSRLRACSYEQERLWWLDQLVPGYIAHTIVTAFHLKGPVSEDLLRSCMLETAMRHDALRTRFIAIDGTPFQSSDVDVPLDWHFEDRTNTISESAIVTEVANRESQRPFQLDCGPLLRVILLKFSNMSCSVVLTVHHIVADAHSIGLFVRETIERYDAATDGRTPVLKELPYSYGDFAEWSRQHWDQNRDGTTLDYWKRTLTNLPQSGIDSLYDRARQPGPPLARAQMVFQVDAELYRLLQLVGAQTGATLFMTLAAAFVMVLHKCTGQSDLVIGVPVSGRPIPELYSLVGDFAYAIPLRLRIGDGISFQQFLEHVRSRALEAYSHAMVPFSEIVSAAHLQASTGFNSIFQTIIGLLKDPFASIQSASFSLDPIYLPTGHSDADIFLTMLEHASGLQGLLVYNENLFDETTIVGLTESFLEMLRRATTEPDGSVSEWPLSTGLAQRQRAHTARRTYAVAATFTAEPVEDTLRFWSERLGQNPTIRFAPYNQVFQQLLDPDSIFASNQCGANIILLRFEDWKSNDLAATMDFTQALQSAAARFHVPLLIALLSNTRQFAEQISAINNAIATLPQVHLVTSDSVAELYPVERVVDTYANELAHIPFTPDYFTALGSTLVRRLAATGRRSCKVIAVDCDNTLWQGICGEDGAESVLIDPPHLFFQRFLIKQSQSGVILCLCTKNNPIDVEAVFARDEMALRSHHFSARRVNWQPKSENLRSLAQELNVGLDSFILLDDNPKECAEVLANCPECAVAQIPGDPDKIPEFVRGLWALDTIEPITSEDKLRSHFYRQHSERLSFAATYATLDDYLMGLNIQFQIEHIQAKHFARVAQLTVRTNQFNMTGIRRSEREIAEAIASGSLSGFVIAVSDRFGDYGIVGAVLFAAQGNCIEVDSLVISCRALGRRVEHRILSFLGKIARERDVDFVTIPLQRTGRNEPAMQFLEYVAARYVTSSSGSTTLYRIPVAVAEAADLRERPNQICPPGHSFASTTLEQKQTWGALSEAVRVADGLETVANIRAAMRYAAQTSSLHRGKQPHTETEKIVASIWADVLGIANPPIDLNFFEAGGQSLRASQITARIREALAIDLPLTYFFTGTPTIAGLSQEIERLEFTTLTAGEQTELLSEIDYTIAKSQEQQQ